MSRQVAPAHKTYTLQQPGSTSDGIKLPFCPLHGIGTNGSMNFHEEDKRYDSDSDDDRKLPANYSNISNSDEAIARRLQKEEWSDRLDLDKKISPTTTMESNNLEDLTLANLRLRDDHPRSDDAGIQDRQCRSSPTTNVAFLRQEEYPQVTAAMIKQRKEAEDLAMQQKPDGRAWLFVKQVLELHSQLSASSQGLSTVAVDDMVFLAKAFLACAADFESRGISSRVSLAYHYTKAERMKGIRHDGLMTLADRKQKGLDSSGRAAFGDGVYAATNPTAFRHFGDTGMLVAVLLGKTKRVAYMPGATPGAGDANTLIGNKRIKRLGGDVSVEDKFADELVIQESRQCLPLIQFGSGLTRTDAGRDAVWTYHQALQKLCDKVFNGGKRTVLKRTLVPASALAPKASPIPPSETVGIYIAPRVLPTYSPTDMFETKRVRRRNSPPTGFCAICRDSLWNSSSLVSLKVCGHQYHKACIEQALKSSPTCPTCRAIVRKPQGTSPSGAMSVSLVPTPCKGFEECKKSIVVTYTVPDGIQKSYHENPGAPFKGTTRHAYLPNNEEGKRLLKRLKYAFMNGLTFTIGTSLTTGKPNCVVWGSIHHKTSASGGSYGFPDPTFFARCNSELDSLGVPRD